jgi:hypothetical protein
MSKPAAAIVIAALAFAVARAAAQETAPDSEGGRYTFNKISNGFLRLDTRTGDVSVCSERAVGWACIAAPDERAVLEQEIARLRTENAALKKDMLSRGLSLPADAMAEPSTPSGGDHVGRPRGDSDLNHVMNFFARLWQQLVEAIAHAQQHGLNKS